MIGSGNIMNIMNSVSDSYRGHLETSQYLAEAKKSALEEYQKLQLSDIISPEYKGKHINELTLEQQNKAAAFYVGVLVLDEYRKRESYELHHDYELTKLIVQMFVEYPFLKSLYDVAMRKYAKEQYTALKTSALFKDENKGKQLKDFTQAEQTNMSKWYKEVETLREYMFAIRQLKSNNHYVNIEESDKLISDITQLFHDYPFIEKIGEPSPGDDGVGENELRGGLKKSSKTRKQKRKRNSRHTSRKHRMSSSRGIKKRRHSRNSRKG